MCRESTPVQIGGGGRGDGKHAFLIKCLNFGTWKYDFLHVTRVELIIFASLSASFAIPSEDDTCIVGK